MRTPALTRRHVGELFNKGHSKASICRELGISRVTVDRWSNESLTHAPDMADWGYKAAIMQEWEAIDQSTINKLVEKVPSRIQHIRELGGKWIGGYKDW